MSEKGGEPSTEGIESVLRYISRNMGKPYWLLSCDAEILAAALEAAQKELMVAQEAEETERVRRVAFENGTEFALMKAERDALLAVIAKLDEALRQYISHDTDCILVEHPSLEDHRCDCRFELTLAALSLTPTAALERHDAEVAAKVWEEAAKIAEARGMSTVGTEIRAAALQAGGKP